LPKKQGSTKEAASLPGKDVKSSVEYIRQQMLVKARKVGADAIIYACVEVHRDHREGDRKEVKAKLLKFE
jgi:hypothetical protein